MIYQVSSTNDDSGKVIYYVHPKGFSYCPVFGSFRDTMREAAALARKISTCGSAVRATAGIGQYAGHYTPKRK